MPTKMKQSGYNPTVTPEGSDALLDSLRSRGFAIFQLESSQAPTLTSFQRASRAFFRQSEAFKNQFRTPELHGYLTPAPGAHELFEIRKYEASTAFKIPEEIRAEWLAGYQLLETVARQVLAAASQRLTSSDCFLDLLDASTLRILHYDRIPSGPASLVQGLFPTHADSSFLTVTPLSSFAALQLKNWSTGAWLSVEEQLHPDELMVFSGECLARLTNNYFPAVVHHPSVEKMRNASETRISSPFFLRPRPEALLDTTWCAPSLVGPLPHALRTPTAAGDIVDNVNGCRDRLPWKTLSYFHG